MPEITCAPRGFTVAIVGMGPRGLSVLERLLVRLTERPADQPVRVCAIDDHQIGAGRVWRTGQPPYFTMNTVAGQVTMYSGPPDGGRARPGAGPSLLEWLHDHPDPALSRLGANDYAPRFAYGHYLRDVYRTITSRLPDQVEVQPVRARVTRLQPHGGGHLLVLDHGQRALLADKVVLTTGHPRNLPDDREQRFREFAARHPGLRYLPADVAPDMDLDAISASDTLGVIGMGLTFYDVMVALTLGRGGRFQRNARGRLRYRPSGREPRIVAGSRSGMPILARGRNQKPPDHVHQPRFLTPDAVAEARRRALRERGGPMLSFARDVRPLLELELRHTYCVTHVRLRDGDRAAEEFASRHARAAADPEAVRALLATFDLEDARLDIDALARPFGQQTFPSPAAFRRRLRAALVRDLDEARRGNLDGPLKAALDVLRDMRNVVRLAVDYGGLLPASHRDEFLGAFVPVNALLSAGPPAERVEQLLALIDAGLIEVVGPATHYGRDELQGRFTVSSPRVAGSTRTATVLVDARTPVPDLWRDGSPLMRQLVVDGMASEYVTVDPAGGERFSTGGLAVTAAPFHLVDAGGRVNPDVYALGIPTEHTRWFTQVGSSRPGLVTGFYLDADAVAKDVLAAVIPPEASPGSLADALAAAGAPAIG